MTLNEFLHARLDEEEAAVRKLFDKIHPGIGTLADPFRETKAKLLADMAAKRRQIDSSIRNEQLDKAAGFEPPAHPSRLTRMALPYSEHPDYRDEWRPA